MKETIVKAEKVCYTYEDGTEALKGINLEIKRGEKIAIMGANGSGKSTFFLHLNGVMKPKSGTIYIDGTPINYSRKGLLEVRKKVGIVFQDPDNQLFSANVIQEISFGILNLGVGEEEAKERVEQVIKELNITEFKEKPTHFLSGGQKKRVAIADILVMDPEVMILDEPASALDPKHARLIDGIVDQLSEKGITVILSTHDVERALIWADRVILFHEGSVVGQGVPEDVFLNQELLTKTNLEKPTVLRIFERLCEVGILDKTLPMPRKAEELERYIMQRR
ncbi:energy-coupling factor ABC transporter ATP-binding protein [Sinanaerobacter sp. ZZT-01]|uniref:energy-coupling factor ABC transporter ATP-binding protein n=1 Tax=Sinanaerobacter sp. ZZT-01 TaxID=3111540 RepID=UPI002D799406|nr:ATP-binding cassette domain-containing protein [Sinanaerobacter sp. ZZT-01]WRR94675.1 ATP-binding cassette domain-containing protein [Sinanaerobacter sp. ZZT-01]